MARGEGGGRPKIEINEEQLRKLAMMGCTSKEMAAFFNCSVDTLERRFADIINLGREEGKSSVRRMLWKHGELGNTIALKYLIRNVLKEKLVEDVNLSSDEGFSITVKDFRSKDEPGD